MSNSLGFLIGYHIDALLALVLTHGAVFVLTRAWYLRQRHQRILFLVRWIKEHLRMTDEEMRQFAQDQHVTEIFDGALEEA